VRIPIIPDYNTDIKELSAMAKFLSSLRLKAVELLPYHTMGNYKYQALDRTPFVYEVPTEEKMAYYKTIFGIS
jgi:pyruvate formate lyase activating enzyme